MRQRSRDTSAAAPDAAGGDKNKLPNGYYATDQDVKAAQGPVSATSPAAETYAVIEPDPAGGGGGDGGGNSSAAQALAEREAEVAKREADMQLREREAELARREASICPKGCWLCDVGVRTWYGRRPVRRKL